MIYGSVCSGIEAASVAWKPIGWSPSFFSEIDPFPRVVLAHHYPEVPLHGDFTTIEAGQYAAIDILVGGTPCQSFSVAGLRAGLDDDRGNLALEFCRLARRLGPRWVVWENVPGVLSLDGGRAFGSILGGLAECGYGLAYRVLDAQYVRVDGYARAVPQRRNRVFVVGHLGSWQRAAAVLFEPESLRGGPAPRRAAGQITAPGTGGSAAFGGGRTSGPVGAAACLTAKGMRIDFEVETFVTHALRAEGFDASEDGTGRGTPIVPCHAFDARQSDVVQYGDVTGPLDTDGGSIGVMTFQERGRDGGRSLEVGGDVSYALTSPNGGGRAQERNVMVGSAVRRLTPRECERLMGFPDDYTLIAYRGKSAADGPRYKALGNSMACNVMRWIGRRIAMVERIQDQIAEAAE